MKVSRLLASVLCFLLVINFFRTVNGAGFVGSAEVLDRLDAFDLDLSPISNLVALWEENNFGNNISSLAAEQEAYAPSFGEGGIMTVPSVGGGENGGGGTFGGDDSGTDYTGWFSNLWSSITNIASIFTSFGGLFETMQAAIKSKVDLVINTVKYIWTNGIALVMIPIQLISETFSFTFWLLGFGG